MNVKSFSPLFTPMVLIGIVLLSGCVQQGVAFLTYDSPELGIKFNYPLDWTEKDFSGTSVAFSSPTSTNALSIIVADLSDQPMTLDEYTKLTLANIERNESTNVIESGAITLDGNPAYKVIFDIKLKKSNVTMKSTMVWTVKGDLAYVIAYSSMPDDYSDAIADEAIRSFEIRTPIT